MIFEYTPETDTLYIQFKNHKNVSGENLNNRVVAFYTDKNELSALEIEHAKKVVNLKEIEVNGQIVNWSKALPPKNKKKLPRSTTPPRNRPN